MPRCISRLGQRVGPRCAVRGVDARVRIDRVCAVRSRHDFWNHQRRVWRCGPRCDGDCDQRADADADGGRHRRDWLLHLPEPSAWPCTSSTAELRRLQEDRSRERAARRRRRADDRLRARDRRHHRAGDGHRRDPAAAVRRGDPQGRRRRRTSSSCPSRAATRSAWPASRPASSAGRSTRAASPTSATAASTSTAAAATRTTSRLTARRPIRTRSSGAIIGIQNVDAIQEVQVLTANYMPEFGRSSGGQIRFVTKSGSNRFSGSASFFYRTTRSTPTAGRATAAPTRSRTAGRRPSTRSSTATPSAARFRSGCSRTSCSSSARRSG